MSARVTCSLIGLFTSLVSAAALSIAVAGGAMAQDRSAAPPIATTEVHIAGLKAPAEILVDRWGVPHIYAKSEDDVFFAQGFNAARDRLFQIDLWRRRGLGELSEVLGPAFVEQDQAARLFLYRGDMYREWLSYASDAKRITTQFAAGVNAYIDYATRNPDKLSWEFKAFDYKPAKWKPEDVMRIRSHGLTRNLTSEVARARTLCRSGDVKNDVIRFGLQPAWEAQVPEGLDPCLPDNVLRVFTLATRNVQLTKENFKRADAAPGPATELAAALADPDTAEGSNNWVVSPRRSATGRAILANDPHRAYASPSLRYIAHISAPGLNVIGAGEPGLPGLSIGHNGTIAFGLTIFNIDQEDLYVYELNPDQPDEYKYQGRWEPMRTVREEITVRGGEVRPAELKFTRHGPVIFVDKEKNRAYAVRSAWMEPGMSPYFVSTETMRARNWDQFAAGMNRWGAPTLNQVYADKAGNIGWISSGLAPKRPNWDGLLPVPGDGRYEWAGFWDRDQMPSVYNPREGWFATANQMNLPADYPYKERKLGFEWTNESRFKRAAEVLAAKSKVTLEDSMRLQNDYLSIPARRLQALLKTLSSDDPNGRAALALLTKWDAVLSPTSSAAALHEVWFRRHLGPAFKAAVLPKAAADVIETPDAAVMLAMLEQPDQRFGVNPTARRDEILLSSLSAAYAEMEKLQGKDAAQWQWGKLHHSLPEHPFAAAVDDSMRSKINVGPLPKGGSPFTPNQSSYRTNDFRLTNGPSFRMVVDVGNWDNSWAVNMPGQSGDPDNPHYRDLAEMWLNGKYFPLLYSRSAVEKAATQRIVLRPGKS